MSLDYAAEKLWEAVETLATDKGRIKARLQRAALGAGTGGWSKRLATSAQG